MAPGGGAAPQIAVLEQGLSGILV
jgi:hypothetical protein